MSTVPSTWSLEDYSNALCAASQVGTPIDHSVWHLADFRAGLCPASSVNKPKVQAPLEQDIETVETTPQAQGDYSTQLLELGQAALEVVLKHPGGAVAWFKENPSTHTKLLVKLATPIQQGSEAQINVNISWLSPSRLSYKFNELGATSTEDVEPKSIEPPSTEAWKEKTPEVIGVNSLIKSLK